jgi:hypothetical protein
VRTDTKTSSGSNVLPGEFVKALPGMGGYTGTNVKSCARASWGQPQTVRATSALTISVCDYNRLAGGVGGLQPRGPYPSPTRWPAEQVIYLQGTAGVRGAPSPEPKCPAGRRAPAMPSGFGWVQRGTTTMETVGGWLPAGSLQLSQLRSLVGQVIDVPVYEAYSTHNGYQVEGFAPFYLTGYTAPAGGTVASLVNRSRGCPSGNRADTCIKGFFTHDLVPAAGSIGTGPDLGTVVVALTD